MNRNFRRMGAWASLGALLLATTALPSAQSAVTTLSLQAQSRLWQPIGYPQNVAACSLRTVPIYWGRGDLRVIQWDPVALAPDPTTVALRSRGYSPSELGWNALRADYVPPIVTQFLADVAEPPGYSLALDYLNSDGSNNQQYCFYDPAAPPSTPTAYEYSTATGQIPLTGPHPALVHKLYTSPSSQQLLVVQSVMTTNALMDTSTEDFIQLIRFPERVVLTHAELAAVLESPNYNNYLYFPQPPMVAIVDAQGGGAPPLSPTPMTTAMYPTYVVSTSTSWLPTFDFDTPVTLLPDHDYWLWVQIHHNLPLYARLRTGGERALYTSNIGTLYRRQASEDGWTALPDRDLSFRLIGNSTGDPLGVNDPPPLRTRFHLSAAPNPAFGSTRLSWTGAQGAVRFDVLDAHGRRVGGGVGAGSTQGSWTWSARGSVLAPGLYFVRARDGAGHVALERVVLIR